MVIRRGLILSALLLGLFVGTARVDARPVQGVKCPIETGAQVVLDPGHGGSDTGAVNTNYGLVEKDLTLKIAMRAAEMLSSSYTVALTRYDDVSLGNSERGEVANACGALVFVEIHLNGSSNPAIDYTQTFWGKKNKDLAFSRAMHDALVANIPNVGDNGVGQFANGGLLTASMPSTLAETVFITSDYEGPLLADSSSGRLDQIASGIAAGVRNGIGG